MSVGLRIFQSIERAPAQDVELFRGLPVANIADNMNRIYCMDQGMRPFNRVPLLGTAFTVKVPGGDNLMLHKAIELAKAGDVLVVNGFGYMDRSLIGGLMFETARQKGIAGCVSDGAIGDVDDIAAMDNFSVYARGVQANGPYKNGPGEIGVPVAVGGQVVLPGDIIAGDTDNVIVIPSQDARAVAAAAAKQYALELQKKKDYSAGKVNREWLSHALQQAGVEMV